MIHDPSALADLGWGPFFQGQLDAAELALALPARVVGVHRGALEVHLAGSRARLATPGASEEDAEEAAATIGDWLLIDGAAGRPLRRLERKSLFKRRAAGTAVRVQLIAANVDTLFVVSSCNEDFNPARLERYLALARQAGVTPVLVLTKADLAADPAAMAAAAARLARGLPVETLDARDAGAAERLRPWCGRGQTVALVGSSGVGKSTLVNTLIGAAAQATREIREDDGRGRHTTSARSMHPLAAGGWLIDTPGMRELQLADVAAGLALLFEDIADLAARCRFSDCRHDGEPGCAVLAGVAAGSVDPDRLRRWRKLAAEEARNSETLTERRSRIRAQGRLTRDILRRERARREGDHRG